ncbi:MAG: hypothetical protein K9J85_06400 [Desulfobacteraceae bacterium]|nr:hypothetical protein [Desulfobacteraceae bacterium]
MKHTLRKQQKDTGVNWIMLFAGLGVLMAGTLVYLIDRPPDTYFVKKMLSDLNLYQTAPPVFGKLGTVVPAFVHPFSFSLITAAFAARTMRGCFLICIFWFAANSAFELGQYFKEFSSSLVPGWFSHIPYLENTRGFFLSGTFDPMDLLAMFLGAIAAFFLAVLVLRKK